jgi:NAD(P)-dependent dehydrogenase (short-subunit alcohol dehydrogenase family)
MKVDLTGKVAVVTGGGGILCSVMAEALAKSGAKVAILDLREENAKKVADKINAEGGKAIGLAANVLELESLQKANEIIKAELGICDILITLTKEHGSANTFKTFLYSKICSNGTIHTAAHCNQRFGTGIHAIPPY